MAETARVFCGPCDYNKESQQAVLFCTDCDEGFCDACVKAHKGSKLSKDHHLLPVEDYTKVKDIYIDQECQKHGAKQLNFFCPTHDEVLCLLCIQSEHSKCSDILAIKDAAKDAKTSTELYDLEKNLDSIIENTSSSIEIQQVNMNCLLENKLKIREKIKRKRQQINERLDELEKKLLEKLEATYQQGQKEINEHKESLVVKEKDVTDLKEKTSQMKKFSSDIKFFIGVRTTVKELMKKKEEIKSLIRKAHKYELQLKLNTELDALFKEISSFGEVHTSICSDNTTFVESNVKEAQFHNSLQCKVTDVNLQLRHKISLGNLGRRRQHNITGCIIIENGQLILLERDRKSLDIYNEDGAFDRSIRVPRYPFDGVALGKEQIAVTYGNCHDIEFNKILSFVVIDTAKIKNIPVFKNWGWGISESNRKLYVKAYGEGIKVLDENGSHIRTIYVDVDISYKLTVCSDTIYIPTDKEIVCFNTDGKLKWKFRNLNIATTFLRAAVTYDRNGNVFVVGVDIKGILVISKDGNEHKVLQSASYKPPRQITFHHAIDFSEKFKRLLWCYNGDDNVLLYDVVQ